MTFGFRRADMPEAPPPEFRDPTPPPGWKVEYFPSEIDLTNWAQANKIADNGHKFFLGGVAPSLQTIGLLQPGRLRDDPRQQAVAVHEIGGHANGLEHDEHGHGWGYRAPDGVFTPVVTRADLASAKAAYTQRMPAVDWSKAFADAGLGTETGATTQARGGR